MKQYAYKVGTKVTAGILLIILNIIIVAGILSTSFAYTMGFYENVPVELKDSILCERVTRDYISNDLSDYMRWYLMAEDTLNRSYYLDRYGREFSPENTNLKFVFTNPNGEVIFSNCGGVIPEDTLIIQNSLSFYGYYDIMNIESVKDSGNGYLLKGYVDEITVHDEYYSMQKLYQTLYACRYASIVLAIGAVIFSVLLMIFLISSAGTGCDRSLIKLRLMDRIPYDLVLVLMFCLLALMDAISSDMIGAIYSLTASSIVIFVDTFLVSLLLIYLFMTTAARIKHKRLIKGSIIYFILHLLWSIVKQIGSAIADIFHHMYALGKTVLCIAGIGLIALVICIMMTQGNLNGGALFLGFLLYIAVSVIICMIIVQFQRVKEGSDRMAQGNFTGTIPAHGISRDVGRVATNLNGINEALTIAVDERMKSERMKAELITNVSHDIKTPLTSIINYVDLLKKEHIDNATAAEYIEVLDRQSSKLKKLIYDLVEASKASTGNISCNPQPMNVAELLSQSVAEYAERLSDSRLTPVITSPGDVIIMADGKLMWRVIDNLLGNICKYSQPDTRVYIDVTRSSEEVCICFKNISKDSLGISPDELMQRFVRGDSARTTEGSGLGLSIAQSLTEIQNGTFVIDIDGDLFKAKVFLKRASSMIVEESKDNEEAGKKN